MKENKCRLDVRISIRIESEMEARLGQIARRSGMKRTTLNRKVVELAADEMRFYGSFGKLRAAWSTPEGADHIDRVLRGLEKPRRVP